jgi:hypothetical protein
MKKYYILLLLVCISIISYAQQGNNWTFGYHCGVNFNKSPAEGFSSAIQDVTYNLYARLPQTISDCSGKLLYYVGGDSLVWNREHKLLPSKGLLMTGVSNNFFIAAPGNDSFVYLFQYDFSGEKRCYRINNYLDSGRGDIEPNYTVMSTKNGTYGGYIKHKNDTDYWIFHKPNNMYIDAYLLTKQGLSKTPISSVFFGEPSGYSGNSPYMRSSNNGKFIISPAIGVSSYPQKTYKIYNFDNATGQLSNPREIIPNTQGGFDYTFSFSPNDSILYAVGYKFNATGNYTKADSFGIYQLPTYGNVNLTTYPLAFQLPPNARGKGGLGPQLGPDNRLYFNVAEDTLYRSLLYIKYPDVWGKGCEFVTKGLQLPLGCSIVGYKFPCHSFPIKRINNRFQIPALSACSAPDTLRFAFDGDSAFNSWLWYFGDGDSAEGKSVVHTYNRPGKYYVSLGCGLGTCGYKQWVGDSILVKFKPLVSGTSQQHIYCGYQSVEVNLKYAYTTKVRVNWGDGKDTTIDSRSIIIDSALLQHIYAQSGSYKISCKVWNDNCEDSIIYIHAINIDTLPKSEFTANQTITCTGDMISLTDTAGLDSIVGFRTWHIYNSSGYDSTFNSALNPFNIKLGVSGIYSFKLKTTSRQGCIDSLEKLNYIEVKQGPVVRLSGQTTLCIPDSAVLTASGIGSYLWNTGDTANFIVIKPQVSSIYSIAVTGPNGCIAKDSIWVDVGPKPQALFTANYFASCGSSSFTFSDTSIYNGNVKYRYWHIQNTSGLDTILSTTGNNQVNFTVQDTGVYTIGLKQVTHIGCIDSSAKHNYIKVYPLPIAVVSPSGKINICYGDSVKLSLPKYSKYLWNTGDTSQYIYVTKKGIYNATLWNEYNCLAKTSNTIVDALGIFNGVIKQNKDSLYTLSSRKPTSYYWLKDSLPFLGNTQAVIYQPAAGKYTATLTDSFGCVTTTNKYIVVSGVSSIVEESIRVYPNPATNELYIENVAANIAVITLTDLAGKVVMQVPNNGEKRVKLSVQSLSSGIYILETGMQRVKVMVE